MRIFTILLNFKTKLLLLFFLISFCSQISTVEGAPKSWTGGSAAWTTPGNWSPFGVPGPADDVVIGDLSVSFWPTLSTTLPQTIKSLTFNALGNGITLTVNSSLVISGSFVQENYGYRANTINFITGTGSIKVTNFTVGDATQQKNGSSSRFLTRVESTVKNLFIDNLFFEPTVDPGPGNSFNYSWIDSSFRIVSGTLTLTNSLSNNGLYKTQSFFRVFDTAKLILLGANALNLLGLGSFNVIDFQPGSVVEYAGAVGQTVYTNTAPNVYAPNISYSNIIFSGAGQKNVDIGNLLVSGNWTSSGGKVDLSTTNPTVNFNGNTAQILSDAGSDAAKGVYFKNVTFSNGGTKSIDLGKFSVATNGILTMADLNTILEAKGNLYLKSDASGSANVEVIPAGCLINGDVNVESWLTGGSAKMRWTRMMSPPIDDTKTLSGNKVYQQLQKQLIITGPGGVANGFDKGNAIQPYAVTLTQFTESLSKFTSVPNLTDASVVKPGDGFFLFFRGNRSGYTSAADAFTTNKLNPLPFAIPESFAVTYKGPLNQGPISVTLSKAVSGAHLGYNVIGNPYPATIDFALLYNNGNSSNIANQYTLPKPDQTGTMSYSGVSGIVTNGTVTNAAAANALAKYIQPGQSFYVIKTNPGTSTYTTFFNESVKATSKSPARLLSNPSDKILHANTRMSITPIISNSDSGPWPVFRMNVQNGLNTDETVVLFKEGFPKEYNGDDIPYFSGSTVSLSTLSGDDKSLAINFMPDLKDVQEIKLNLNATASGPLKLNFTDFAATDGFLVFLKDALFPQILINVKESPVYDFFLDKANPASYGSSRFTIVFKPALIAAPGLFTAKKIRSYVDLNWTTETAKDIQYFEVEVSVDQVLYNTLGIVKNQISAGANVSYVFVDKGASSGVNFYRLKQVNKNGTISYSDVRIVDLSISKALGAAVMKVYPNPATDKIQVELNGKFDYDIQACIFNMQGEKLKNTTFLSAENIGFTVSQLPKGIYILELKRSENNKLIGRSKFVVGL